jgi:hypothetical protein
LILTAGLCGRRQTDEASLARFLEDRMAANGIHLEIMVNLEH